IGVPISPSPRNPTLVMRSLPIRSASPKYPLGPPVGFGVHGAMGRDRDRRRRDGNIHRSVAGIPGPPGTAAGAIPDRPFERQLPRAQPDLPPRVPPPRLRPHGAAGAGGM